ncbi:MAG: FkbM family methyltransferase [Bacteroidales bacterium]|nr:FkbM family methyltransferase [Bacteroidales bacterium]
MSGLSLNRPVIKAVKWLRNNLTGNSVINYREKGIINFIDAGSLGRLPEPWFSNSRHIKNLLSFEPLEESSKRKNVMVSSVALWSSDCKRPFYVYKGIKGSGSSLFEQNFDYVNQHFETLKKIGPGHLADTWHKRSELSKVTECECRTLDHILKELNLPYSFDFLKIDTQGAEYEILKGAGNFLRESCIGLQLELFNIPLYKGIKLMPEVTGLLNGFGFILVKKMPFHGSFNSQNDCIFIKQEVPANKKAVRDLIMNICSVNKSF